MTPNAPQGGRDNNDSVALAASKHEALTEHAKRLFERYEPAFRCKRCGTYLLPDGIGLHEQWHEEPRR